MAENAIEEMSFPVAVILARQQVTHGKWTVPQWRAAGLVAGNSVPSRDSWRTLVHTGDDGAEHYLWGGLTLKIEKEHLEGYYNNLVGGQPALFILCHEDPHGNPEPYAVTADGEEATAGLECDSLVYRAAIPEEIYPAIERFVVQHYVPREPKKRKRKNWSRDDGRG